MSNFYQSDIKLKSIQKIKAARCASDLEILGGY